MIRYTNTPPDSVWLEARVWRLADRDIYTMHEAGEGQGEEYVRKAIVGRPAAPLEPPPLPDYPERPEAAAGSLKRPEHDRSDIP